jgi:tRNA modification GTPase
MQDEFMVKPDSYFFWGALRMNFTDTIAAIATPPGEGGIGIIRISGNGAQAIALECLRRSDGTHPNAIEDHKIYYGMVYDPLSQQQIDEVIYFYLQKPRSFTAEDVVEIQAHGGILILTKILRIVLRLGARLAEPGEFTMRAFLNGRIDLVQAESVIDLIRAKTDRAHEIALSQLTGRTTGQLQALEAELYQLLIAIEAVLDYPEEGIPEIQKTTLLKRSATLITSLSRLVANVDEGRKIREGVQVVIVGRPNVGKSSLLNAFIQEERAIVTEIPGTTRDVIEAQLQLSGIPFILIDTAGVRKTDNPIEKIGIDKAEKYLQTADLVLLVLDGSQALTEEDRYVINKISESKKPFLAVINKADLPLRADELQVEKLTEDNFLLVSSLTREGFPQLENKIIDLVGLGKLQMDDRPFLSRVRHKDALTRALAALQTFQSGLRSGYSEDLLAVDLRTCLAAIGEITGKEVSAEVVHGIFTTFCIGK